MEHDCSGLNGRDTKKDRESITLIDCSESPYNNQLCWFICHKHLCSSLNWIFLKYTMCLEKTKRIAFNLKR